MIEIVRCLAVLASIGLIEVIPQPSRQQDCGLHDLYTCLHLQERGVALADLEHLLPQKSSKGYSLGELKACAEALGVKPQVRTLDLQAHPIDRPMIAFLDREDGGHFVVIQPVGHSGKLVQVFDSVAYPRVVDRHVLSTDPTWTGYVLDSTRFRLETAAAIVATCLGFALLIWNRSSVGTA